MMGGNQSNRAVAVAGNGFDGEAALYRYAALIHEFAGLSTRVLLLDDCDVDQLHARLPPEVSAVFLTGTNPEYVLALAGDMPVLTEQDVLAIAIAAAVLTSLARSGCPLDTSRVVIAGANTSPTLSPLLTAAGVGAVTTWRLSDAPAFPLHRIAPGADAVVDLLDGAAGLVDALTVITPDREHDPLLALPGLLLALTRTPHTTVDTDVQNACALALVMATPPELALPPELDHALTDHVADAAIEALRGQPRPHNTSSG